MTRREQRAWLANLTRLQAEKKLLMGVHDGKPETIRSLVEAATGDSRVAHDVMVESYKEELMSSI